MLTLHDINPTIVRHGVVWFATALNVVNEDNDNNDDDGNNDGGPRSKLGVEVVDVVLSWCECDVGITVTQEAKGVP